MLSSAVGVDGRLNKAPDLKLEDAAFSLRSDSLICKPR